MSNPPIDKHPSVLYQNSDLPSGYSPNSATLKEAAVLIPLIRINNQWEIVYIRRTENKNDRHSGQVAFPGGARDPVDSSLIDTALRETEEEIGVSSNHITIIDALEAYLTVSDFKVTPVVAHMAWPVELALAPTEVARVFSIPLVWLKQADNLEVRARDAGDSTNKRHPVIYFNRYDGELLWGASARMTLNFIKALDENRLVLPTEL